MRTGLLYLRQIKESKQTVKSIQENKPDEKNSSSNKREVTADQDKITGQHRMNDSDELSGDMTQRVIATLALCDLSLVVISECAVVAYDVVGGVDQRVPKQGITALGHTGGSRGELAGLAYDGIKPDKGEKLGRMRKPRNLADVRKDHRRVDRSDAGDCHQFRGGTVHDLGNRVVHIVRLLSE